MGFEQWRVAMRVPIGLMFVLFSPAPLLAQSDLLRARSESAVSVTGDITIEADRIVFGNGASLRLVPVEGRRGVFKADPPGNPILLNGNRLCPNDVTFVVLAEGVNDVLFMKMFEGADAPLEAISDSLPQVGSCATYEYQH